MTTPNTPDPKAHSAMVRQAWRLRDTEGHFAAATYLRGQNVPFHMAHLILLGCWPRDSVRAMPLVPTLTPAP